MRFRIDLKIFLFIILFYFTKQLELYALIMIFAILHELGHLCAGLISGFKPEKLEIKPYQVLLVNDGLDIIDTTTPKDAKVNTIILGKKVTADTSLKLLVDLVYRIIKKELQEYKTEYKEIVDAVIELAILNEFPTRITGRSHYLTGDPTLNYLKRQIYPYWLMYLGADKEEMMKFMMRDKIAFDIDKYSYEKELKKKDILGFIDFCIRNQKYIVKIHELEII